MGVELDVICWCLLIFLCRDCLFAWVVVGAGWVVFVWLALNFDCVGWTCCLGFVGVTFLGFICCVCWYFVWGFRLDLDVSALGMLVAACFGIVCIVC